MEIVIASRNQHKIGELEALLAKYVAGVRLLSLDDVGIEGDIEENGTAFSENALIKARAAASSGKIGVGDDSGLCVNALGGAPGIYSARYAGEHGNDALNNEKLLAEMKDVTNRKAAFVCSIACVFPDSSEPIVTEGRIEGEILHELKGSGGFGYDPLFYVPEIGKTLAQALPEEKNGISHRARALAEFSKEFSARFLKK